VLLALSGFQNLTGLVHKDIKPLSPKGFQTLSGLVQQYAVVRINIFDYF